LEATAKKVNAKLMNNTVDFREQSVESTPLIRWSERFNR